MQVVTLKEEDLDFHVQVSVSSNEIEDKINRKLLDKKQTTTLPGFRPGTVTLSIIKKKYGQAIRADVIEHEMQHAVTHIIKDNQLEIADMQREVLQNEEGKDLEFVLKFEKFPKISMPDFKNIKVIKPKLLIKDEDIDVQLAKLADLAKECSTPSDAKIKAGDRITIDATGYIDGVAFDGGTLTNHKLVIGSGAFIAGFEDQLISHAKGDEVEVNVVFPEDYHAKNLSGKPAKFIVKINEVHVADPVEINDEFAKKFKANSLQELRDHIAKRIELESAESINTAMKMELFHQLEQVLTFDVPPSFLVKEIKLLTSEANKDNHTKSLFEGKSEKEVSDYYHKLAMRRIRVGLVLSEYTKNKELRIEQEDLQNAVLAQARKFVGQERAVFDFYNKNPKALEGLKGGALEAKSVQHIFDNEVTLEVKEYTREELQKFLEATENTVLL